MVWLALARSARQSARSKAQTSFTFLDSCREFLAAMIILLHPRSTKPKNRRFPLAVLSLAAVLEGKEEFTIVDGNADSDAGKTLDRVVAVGRWLTRGRISKVGGSSRGPGLSKLKATAIISIACTLFCAAGPANDNFAGP